jgi:hypothetical protein
MMIMTKTIMMINEPQEQGLTLVHKDIYCNMMWKEQ